MIFHNLTLAKTAGTERDKREAWVYFIHGQSNAAGNSPNSNLTAPLNTVIPNCWIYHKPNATTDNDAAFDVDNGTWQPLSTSYNQLTDILANNWYGPELKFGYEMQNYLKRDIFIIKFAIGDTALNSENTAGNPGAGGLLDWAPGSVAELYERSVNNYWIPARDKLLSYGRIPIAKAILFMQGERDSFYSAFASAWLTNEIALDAAWRDAYGNNSLEMVIGRISNEVAADRPFGTVVAANQTTAGAAANHSLIDTDAYVNQGDNVHFADHSVLGNDFYLAVRDL